MIGLCYHRAKLVALAFVLMALAGPVQAGGSDDGDVTVHQGRFLIGGAEMPSGCLQRLMTELDGDDVTASIFLTRSSVRGCLDANDPGRAADYKIMAQRDAETFDVKVCERLEGSMGANCGTLILRFAKRSYILGDQVKDVLVLEKLGEVL